MKLEVRKNGLWILAENAQDDAYIRDTLKIENGKSIKLNMILGGSWRGVDYRRRPMLTTEPQQEES